MTPHADSPHGAERPSARTTHADSPHGAERPSARTTIATHGPLGPGRAATGVRAVIEAAREAPLVPVAILGGLMLVAILADLIAPHDPTLPVKGANVFDPPFWMEGGRTTTLLGTDFQGRDVLSRLIHGARVSLIVGLMGTLVAGGIGTAMGILSGYVGRWVDQVIMRVTDAWLGFPALVFAISLARMVGRSMWNIVFVLGAVSGRATRASSVARC